MTPALLLLHACISGSGTYVEAAGPLDRPEGAATHPADQGPATRRLVLATSGDGVYWVPEDRVLTDLADVPSCLVHDGRLWVLFVLWEDGSGRLLDTTVAAWTEDLERWTFTELWLDLPSEVQGGADPSVVHQAHPGAAEALRLYVAASRPDEPARVHALSSDVMTTWHWEAEVLSNPDHRVVDASVLWFPEDELYRVMAGGDATGGVIRGESADGLEIDLLEPAELSSPDGDRLKPSNGLLLDGEPRYWAFAADQAGGDRSAIWSLSWTGDRWQVDPEPALVLDPDSPVEHDALSEPAVCPHPAGDGWVMVYATGMPPEAGGT